MVAPNLIENPSAGSATFELVWSFSGTVSTDQNGNIPRYVPDQSISITELQLNVVSAPVGGNCTVVWKKNGAVVATTILLDGVRLLEQAATISLVDGDEFWPEISALTTATPPTTMTMVAR